MTDYEVYVGLNTMDEYCVSDAEYFIGITSDGIENDESETDPHDLFKLIRAGIYEWWRLATESIAEEDLKKVIEAEEWEHEKIAEKISTHRSEVYFLNEDVEKYYVVAERPDEEDDG